MLIDYLRYEAFSGRLQGLFEDGLGRYVDPKHSTGQHVRFAPDWVDSHWGFVGHGLIEDFYDIGHIRHFPLRRVLDEIGISRRSDALAQSEFTLGAKPPTFKYQDGGFPRIEIIIDIDPQHWGERYTEPASYEDTPILYRRSGPARANFSAGDRLVDRHQRRGGYGTLCGIFQTEDGFAFGLTCGHVTRDYGEILVEHPRRIWRFEFGSTFSPFGTTRHYTMCGPDIKIGEVTTQLDAALVACKDPPERSKSDAVIAQAFLKPISTVLQEEPVHFRGASRHRPTPARISAVTVRKSIDLFNDGNLHSVGDVLMLGHRERMYMVQPVSRPGDSGSAVRFGLAQTGPSEKINQWYGMVLGGDEHSAYASHAECIWSWAAERLGTKNFDFFF